MTSTQQSCKLKVDVESNSHPDSPKDPSHFGSPCARMQIITGEQQEEEEETQSCNRPQDMTALHVSLIIADIGALRPAGSSGRPKSPGMQHTELMSDAVRVRTLAVGLTGSDLLLRRREEEKTDKPVFICFNHQLKSP